MAKIESEDSYLQDILKDKLYYQIPIYQRPYQWTEENCEKLLDDLFFNYEDDREGDYFCGSLVLVKSDPRSKTEIYDIVDGQQRLSTFILLAKVLATLYPVDDKSQEYLQRSWSDRHENREKKKKKRLDFDLVGSSAKKDFQDALDFFDDLDASKGENSKSNGSSKSKNNYLKNAICLKDYLEKKEIEDIDDFIEWLYCNVVFITITCPDTDKALRIFNVLNARGLALNATDIFKGELLKKLTEEKEQEELATRWEDLYQKCLDNGFDMETLFSQYLVYLESKTSREKMEKMLVTWFKNLNKPPLEYFKGVEDFYNAYCKVLEMQDWHAHLLSYLASDFWRIILCTSILHHYSDQDIEALKELLVKFYYQNWVAEQTEPKKQTNCNIIKALKEKQSVENIASIVKEYLDYHKITQDFKKNLQDSKLYEQHKRSSRTSWLRPILILVEYSISDDPRPKRIEKDDYHIEHILPQKPDPSSQWVKDFSEEERELYTHSLANLTLLGGNKNSQASNLDFKDKQKIYMGEEIKLNKKKPFKVMTCYKMTIDIAHHYAEWTPKPQKPDPSSQWVKDFSEEERELYTHSLANLTLLGGNKNSQASNLDFKDKQKIYMGEEIKLNKKKPFKVMTCYKMTIDIAHHYAEWTPKPQKPDPSSQWVKDFSEEERELYTHSLANLTLLGGNKNSQASNLDFKDKQKIYMGEEIKLNKKKPFKVMTCYKMTIDIAHHYAEWTPKSLEKRKEELIKIIESMLTL